MWGQELFLFTKAKGGEVDVNTHTRFVLTLAATLAVINANRIATAWGFRYQTEHHPSSCPLYQSDLPSLGGNSSFFFTKGGEADIYKNTPFVLTRVATLAAIINWGG